MKITSCLLLLQLASAAPDLSPIPSSTWRGPYTIVLKDGARYQARGPCTTKAAMALITLANGQLVSVRADAIDAERTRAANLVAQASPAPARSPSPPKARLSFTEKDLPSVSLRDAKTLSAGRQTFSGSGSSVTSPFPLEAGLVRFELRNFGDGPFSVELFDAAGTLVAPLFVQAKAFYGSKSVSIPRAGLYTIKVDAAGAWSGSVAPKS